MSAQDSFDPVDGSDELPSLPTMHPPDSDDSEDVDHGSFSPDGPERTSDFESELALHNTVSSETNKPTPSDALRLEARHASSTSFGSIYKAFSTGNSPATPASQSLLQTPLTSTPTAPVQLTSSRPTSAASSRTKFALSGPWNNLVTPRRRSDGSFASEVTFDTPAIHSRSAFDDRSGNDASFGSMDTGNPPSETSSFREDTLEGGEVSMASTCSQADDVSASPYRAQARPSLSPEATPATKLLSQLPSAELSLVLEVEEASEEAFEGDPTGSVQGELREWAELSPEKVEPKPTFFQLSRRRSSQGRTTKPLYDSPASATTDSSTATRVDGSPASLCGPSFSNGNESRSMDDGDGLNGTLPVSSDKLLVETITPVSKPHPDVQNTPGSLWISHEYSIPLRDASDESGAIRDSPQQARFATPKPSATRSEAERRRDLILSTLSSTSRPRMLATPHIRRILIDSRTQLSSPLSQVAGSTMSTPDSEEKDVSFVSVTSSEDLTTLNRANTSLPASEQPSRHGGIKLNRHLHSLNTQQHLEIRALQEENASLRQQLEELSSGRPRSPSTGPDEEPQRNVSKEEAHRSDDAVAEIARLSELVASRSEDVATLEADAAERQAAIYAQTVEFAVKTEQLETEVLAILEEKDAELSASMAERDRLKAALDANEAATPREMIGSAVQSASDGRAESLREIRAELSALELERDRVLALLRPLVEREHGLDLSDLTILVQHLITKATGTADTPVLTSLKQSLEEVQQSLEEERIGKSSLEVVIDGLNEQVRVAEADLASQRKLLVVAELAAEEHRPCQALLQEQVDALSAEVRELRAQLEERDISLAAAAEASSLQWAELESAHASTLTEIQRKCSAEVELLQQALSLAQTRETCQNEMIAALRVSVEDLENRRALTSSASFTFRSSALEDDLSQSSRNAEIEVDEQSARLLAANQEIGRLRAELASSPFKKTALESQDLRIQVLESLNSKLDSRLDILRQTPPVGSPASSSIANRSIASLQTPRPDRPLEKMPWLEEPTTPAPSSWLSEINRMRSQLDDLNRNLDGNLEQLEKAGSERSKLVLELSDAREEIVGLRRDIARSTDKIALLEQEACDSYACKEASQTSRLIQRRSLESSLSPTQHDLDLAQQKLAQAEATNLAVEKQLQSEIDELEKELMDTRSQKRLSENSLTEALDAVAMAENKLLISEKQLKTVLGEKTQQRQQSDLLEREVRTKAEELDAAASKLRAAQQTEQRLQTAINDVLAELNETRSQVREVSSSQAKDRLALRTSQAQGTLLKNELRSAQKQIRELSRDFEATTLALADARTSLELQRIESRRQQEELASTRLRVETLTRESRRDSNLDQSAREERASIRQTVEGLQAALGRAKEDARRMERDLVALRQESRDASQKSRDAYEKLLLEKAVAEAEVRRLIDAADAAGAREAKLHVQHRSEAKGLLAEIRYLKIKFTRENSFRDDLILQKEYLLDMVGTYTLGGSGPRRSHVQAPVEARPRRTLRATAYAVIMLIRARKLAVDWSKATEVTIALRDAHERVRQARKINLATGA